MGPDGKEGGKKRSLRKNGKTAISGFFFHPLSDSCWFFWDSVGDEKRVKSWYEAYKTKLNPISAEESGKSSKKHNWRSNSEITSEAEWKEHLGAGTQHFEAYYAFFTREKERLGTLEAVLKNYVPKLIFGIWRAAFHCAIDLGWALWIRHEEYALYALAYWSSVYQIYTDRLEESIDLTTCAPHRTLAGDRQRMEWEMGSSLANWEKMKERREEKEEEREREEKSKPASAAGKQDAELDASPTHVQSSGRRMEKGKKAEEGEGKAEAKKERMEREVSHLHTGSRDCSPAPGHSSCSFVSCSECQDNFDFWSYLEAIREEEKDLWEKAVLGTLPPIHATKGFTERLLAITKDEEMLEKLLKHFTTLQRGLNATCGTVEVLREWLNIRAFQLFHYARDVPSRDFFLLHTVTGFHALRFILPFVGNEAAQKKTLFVFAFHLLTVFIAQGRPSPSFVAPSSLAHSVDLNAPCESATLARWKAVQEKSAACNDEHLFKLVHVAKWNFDREKHHEVKELFLSTAEELCEAVSDENGKGYSFRKPGF